MEGGAAGAEDPSEVAWVSGTPLLHPIECADHDEPFCTAASRPVRPLPRPWGCWARTRTCEYPSPCRLDSFTACIEGEGGDRTEVEFDSFLAQIRHASRDASMPLPTMLHAATVHTQVQHLVLLRASQPHTGGSGGL
jgi:hypothetical protein